MNQIDWGTKIITLKQQIANMLDENGMPRPNVDIDELGSAIVKLSSAEELHEIFEEVLREQAEDTLRERAQEKLNIRQKQADNLFRDKDLTQRQ